MSRANSGKNTKRRHKKILALAKGYRGRSNNCYRVAIEKVEKALRYAYRDRRNKKRDIRALWIQRINAGVRQYGLVYSQFMGLIKKSGIDINRKMLSELCLHNPDAFKGLVEKIQAAA